MSNSKTILVALKHDEQGKVTGFTLTGPERTFTRWTSPSAAGDIELQETHTWVEEIDLSKLTDDEWKALAAYTFRGGTNSLQRSFRNGEIRWENYTGEDGVVRNVGLLTEFKTSRGAKLPTAVTDLRKILESKESDLSRAIAEKKDKSIIAFITQLRDSAERDYMEAYDAHMAQLATEQVAADRAGAKA